MDYSNPLYASDVSIPLTIGNICERFFPVALITVAWFLLWYTFLYLQSYKHTIAFHALIKSKKEKRKDSNTNREIINKTKLKRGGYDLTEVDTANTMVRNTSEQSLSFLVLLWLNALYTPIIQTTIAGWIWILARCLYPFVCEDVGSSPLIFLSTLPGYLVQFYFAFNIIIYQFRA